MGSICTREPSDAPEQAAQLEIQRRAAQERERAWQAEFERRRREAATSKRVNEELLKQRQAALRDFAMRAYYFVFLLILYNIWTRHQSQGSLVVATGILIRLCKLAGEGVPVCVRVIAIMCVIASVSELLWDLFSSDVLPWVSNLLHFVGFACEALALFSFYADR